MRVLGVDPGAAGAVAMIDTDLAALLVRDMPIVRVNGRAQLSEAQLAGMLREFDPDHAVVERVHSMPKQGVASTFSFGTNYGIVRGCLAALLVPTELVTANEWKRHFRISSDKAEARVVAARLFPEATALFSRVRDDGRAEAALLALFGTQRLTASAGVRSCPVVSGSV